MMNNTIDCGERSVNNCSIAKFGWQLQRALVIASLITGGGFLLGRPVEAEEVANPGRIGTAADVVLADGLLADGSLSDRLFAADAEDEADAGEREEADIKNSPEAFAASEVLQQAALFATQASSMAQKAATASEWDAIAIQWIEAIALLQSIPPESPARILAQRQLRSYLQQLQDAQRRAEQASASAGPGLGSDLFDAQLAGYLSYVATSGTPDVLIVGSSRALQGIDPQALQQALAERGYADLNVFNFSVNGATAQVVEFVVGELLPEPLPPIVIWGDGSRAFNEGRRDRTWESLRASPGYRAAKSASSSLAVPVSFVAPSNRASRRVTANSPLVEMPGNIDVLGFSAVSDRFDPRTYYQQVSRVDGRYDGAYAGFALNGAQADALGRTAAALQREGTQLLFVNLPLSGSYLDDFRLYYERQFQKFLQAQSAQSGFEVVDLLTQWENQPGFFADPSHINQEGASAIARQLAQQPALVNALESAPRSPESASVPNFEVPPAPLLDLLRPAQISPVQNEPARRLPPPIPPPPAPHS